MPDRPTLSTDRNSFLLRIIRASIGRIDKQLYLRGIRTSQGLTLPNFLGIGAQKAGTTWLDKNLRHHPDLFLPDKKELHYFDMHFNESLRSYADRFLSGAQKVRGEITPAYSILSIDRIRFIRRIMPDVRLVFLMRNPIDRAWSMAVMWLVAKPNRRIEDVSEGEFVELIRGDEGYRRGDYNSILDHWESVFPREQLFIGFYEDLRNRPQELLQDICRHIGIRTDLDWSPFPYNQVIHQGVRIPMPDNIRCLLQEMYTPEIEKMVERFGDRVAGWRTV